MRLSIYVNGIFKDSYENPTDLGICTHLSRLGEDRFVYVNETSVRIVTWPYDSISLMNDWFSCDRENLLDPDFQKHHEWAALYFKEEANNELRWELKTGPRVETFGEIAKEGIAKVLGFLLT